MIPGSVKVCNPYVILSQEKSQLKKQLNLKPKEELLIEAKQRLLTLSKTTKAKEVELKDPRMRFLLRQVKFLNLVFQIS